MTRKSMKTYKPKESSRQNYPIPNTKEILPIRNPTENNRRTIENRRKTIENIRNTIEAVRKYQKQ